MKDININGFVFQYKICYDELLGCYTKFYFGVEINKILFYERLIPKYAFSLPINIENPERSKGELRDVLEARVKKYFSDETRKQEIKNGILI